MRESSWVGLWVSGSIVLLAACGGAAPEPMHNVNDQDAGSTIPTDAGMIDMQQHDAGIESGPVDLNGIWAYKPVTSQIANVFGRDTIVALRGLSRIEVTQTGTTVALHESVCAIALDEVSGIQTLYPQTVIDIVPEIDNHATVSEMMIGANYVVEPDPELMGWEADDPLADVIPDAMDDPRLIDQDGDGFVGITLNLAGTIIADVYVVTRTTTKLNGTIIGKDRIEGANDGTSQQVVLDATSSFIPRGPFAATRDPEPSHSYFKMVRLGASANSCADIIANQTTLFP